MPATVPRFVLCPKCGSLLPEPPAGNPFYRCGNCSTTLQAKHATLGELEATNRKTIAAEQQRRNLYYDSSSGEIVSDAVADEFALTGHRSPLYNQKKQSAKEVVLENGSREMHARGVTKPHRERSEDRFSDPYPQSVRTQDEDVMMAGGEYTPPESAHQEIGSREHWSASPDATSYGMSEARSRIDVTTTLAAPKTMSGVGHSYGTEAIASSDDSLTSNGKSPDDELKQLQLPHVQCAAHPDIARGSVPSDSAHNHQHHDFGSQRIHEPSVNNASQTPIMTAGENISSGPPSRKLQWKVREFDSGDEATSSGAASSKGISEDDEDGSSQENMKSTVCVKETTSVEYNKMERTWRNVQSRRRSFASHDEQQGATAQKQLLGSPSEDADRTIDMYENSAHVLDYEPSDTSSTTMDEVESNGGGGGSGQFSGEMERHALVVEQGSSSSRPVSRPHLLPRSTTNSSRGSVLSEEGSSYGSPTQIETVSPDNHIDNARMTAAARRHSWDERVTGMPPAAPGYAGGPQPGPSAVRPKSSSHDFGSAQTDHLRRMSSVSSDPGGRWSSSKGRQSPASSLYDNYRPASPYGPRSFPQQQWANRYMPPSSPMMQQQWSPNSSQRSFFPEPSPLHPLYSKLPSSARSVPGGQLPPKQGHYPPLPPPGALPHVLCQHCGLLLAVPESLPPNQKNTQKLRCGSCRKISIFSVPQVEGSDAVQGFGSSRFDSLQSQSLLASSPDSQSEFQSTYRTVSDSFSTGERQRGRYSVSDLAEKQVQENLVRKRSLGNEDLTRADQDVVERSLSERAEALAIHSSANSPSSSVPSSSFRGTSDHKSDQPGEIFSNDFPYQRPGGGSPYPRFNNILQNENVGDCPSSKEKVSAGVTMSDSDIEVRCLSATTSPQFNNQTNAGSAPTLLSHPPLQDPRSSEAPNEQGQGQHEVRGLRNLKQMFFGKSKHGGVAQYRRKVVVNGVAIPDHLVKKAEEQAGPIHPGTFWYDGKAGFWGVAGGPCRGIIPPFIEEFNYPMTRDCAAGRTGIFVNGRELHHVDRDKLCRRGLPDSPGMAYHIEIDGRVVEEATGSELRSLGRLAPSLEKSGRGAGMHAPSNSSRS